MNNNVITIVDYGMGNLFSIEHAINHIGGTARITDNPSEIAKAERVILPGVGAFGKGMHELRSHRLDEALMKFIETGRPLLGICLGMQLLFSEGSEFEWNKGLSIISGKVIRFKDPMPDENMFKIPQIGWNCILPQSPASWNGTILDGIAPGSYFYFVHSFICVPENSLNILAATEYGKDSFCSVARKDNVYGCQFHPERSAADGLKIYDNFLHKV
ncbi:MAG: imidazole glycerol phosphate synthase, glutamine amidotransferase subunit [Elusimicrobia bacterium RIFOXYA2_FULL_50_26]|nr:MAG: imidazole glycerol phosphate synthase, glutamine amidotransferase subunit [Elusimicrobia bacterium RIFOXYA2_FULL_50_26]OGS24755.1 MAG: imidazole glycerol phosphate synthase, glutamine amidotransferase subunit [Elusimicrobia bacterium RIFOXYB2_FULL_50_12]